MSGDIEIISTTNLQTVNAFSRISKNYVFRFQIFCHTDLVFSLWAGGGRGFWYFIQLQCTHSKDNPQCSNVLSFVLVIKNNEALLVIK